MCKQEGIDMSNIDPNKNCHEYCPVAKCCRFLKGGNGIDPWECAMRDKIEDLIEDARTAREDQYEVGEDW